MTFFELYDRLIGRWSRVRAHIFGHLIAAGLLWAIGFNPPLPRVDLRGLRALANPENPLLESAGTLALASLAAAALIAVYTIILDEVGRALINIMFRIFPPHIHLERWEPMVSRTAWFTIAATLPAGERQPYELRQRAQELLSLYMMKHKAKFAAVANEDNHLRQDLYTHLRNSLLFLSLWLVLPALLPTGAPLTVEILRVHGPGTVMFLLYFIVSHARMAATSHRYHPRLYEALADLILEDEAHKERVATAHANQQPYFRLIHAMLEDQERVEPSIKAYLARRLRSSPNAIAARKRLAEALDKLESLSSDKEELTKYDKKGWLRRYVEWRVARAIAPLGYRPRQFLRRLDAAEQEERDARS